MVRGGGVFGNNNNNESLRRALENSMLTVNENNQLRRAIQESSRYRNNNQAANNNMERTMRSLTNLRPLTNNEKKELKRKYGMIKFGNTKAQKVAKYKNDKELKKINNIRTRLEKKMREKTLRNKFKYLPCLTPYNSTMKNISNKDLKLNIKAGKSQLKEIGRHIIKVDNMKNLEKKKIWKDYYKGKFDNATLNAKLRSLVTLKKERYDRARQNEDKKRINNLEKLVKQLKNEFARIYK